MRRLSLEAHHICFRCVSHRHSLCCLTYCIRRGAALVRALSPETGSLAVERAGPQACARVSVSRARLLLHLLSPAPPTLHLPSPVPSNPDPSSHELCPSSPTRFAASAPPGYWTIATVTTTGYGDIVPTTVLGKLLGCIIMLAGLVILALPITLISTNFAEAYEAGQLSNESVCHAPTCLYSGAASSCEAH